MVSTKYTIIDMGERVETYVPDNELQVGLGIFFHVALVSYL